MKKNLTSRFAVQYTDGRAEQSRAEQSRAEQVKLCPFVLFPQRYEKTIVFGNSIIVYTVDNGADRWLYEFGKSGKERVVGLNPGESATLSAPHQISGAVIFL